MIIEQKESDLQSVSNSEASASLDSKKDKDSPKSGIMVPDPPKPNMQKSNDRVLHIIEKMSSRDTINLDKYVFKNEEVGEKRKEALRSRKHEIEQMKLRITESPKSDRNLKSVRREK